MKKIKKRANNNPNHNDRRHGVDDNNKENQTPRAKEKPSTVAPTLPRNQRTLSTKTPPKPRKTSL